MSGASPARYTRRAFPVYAFLPGRDPHPTRDPRGHSYSLSPHATPRSVPPQDWRQCEDYLFGVDLYNHGYLWEAHEAWEGLWQVGKHDPLQAEFLQGLIQCAAACLKIPMGQPTGLERLCELGTGRLERVAAGAGERYMGLWIPPFVDALRAFAASAPATNDARPRLELALP